MMNMPPPHVINGNRLQHVKVHEYRPGGQRLSQVIDPRSDEEGASFFFPSLNLYSHSESCFLAVKTADCCV